MQQLVTPPLNNGETYIGAIGDKNGDVYHIILLPGDNDDSGWQNAMDWAKSIGGDLPNRVEQAMLYAQHKEEFKKDWYWSCEQHASYSGCAWSQYFLTGYQGYHYLFSKLRARAVRRWLAGSMSGTAPASS